jgi:methionyl-tRNA formyltransferase
MRVVFAGTPGFAVAALEAIAEAGHDLMLVLTRPDRASGRGLATVSSPVKRAAERRGIPVFQPASLRDVDAQARVRGVDADVMVVVAYGLILPQPLLDLPRRGALNIHASLLPRWRGAAPIQRAIMAGDRQTGISIMQMDAGLDTGPVVLREAIPIAPDATSGTLHDQLAALGAKLIVSAFDQLARGTLTRAAQPSDGITYAHKIEKIEACIDWTRGADEIERCLRAFDPSPGASTVLGRSEMKVWRAAVLPGEPGAAGTVLRAGPSGIDVACGDGALRILELQRAGGKRLSAEALLRGFPVRAGDRLGVA